MEQYNESPRSPQNRYSPKRLYYEAVNELVSQDTGNPLAMQDKLSPLIKDYKAKAIYEKPMGNYSPKGAQTQVPTSLGQVLPLPAPHGNGHQPPPLESSFQHYRANNFENRNKVIWNNTDFRIFHRDNPRSLGGPIPVLGETSVIPLVREQRKIRGINPRMPLEDPQIRLKLGLRIDSESQMQHRYDKR
ncbi:hypothetical protein FGO68_gene3255 [Halteria grandinella]|uniref:Uncharacterized protein n=1 Tax=Halteria grandinella TaxID=5974 RepID=A0A8J8NPN9_HALGN|nr:hypothetical protein FGO68_gene3255 [Halteria grandinella]